jgi:hypothetical protein
MPAQIDARPLAIDAKKFQVPLFFRLGPSRITVPLKKAEPSSFGPASKTSVDSGVR